MISSRKCEEDISNLSKLGTTILSAKIHPKFEAGTLGMA